MRILDILFQVLISLIILALVLAIGAWRAGGEPDDQGWLAGMIQSEGMTQPFPAQCGMARIVYEESGRRGISVQELVTSTGFIHGYTSGGAWHRYQYAHPQQWARDIAAIAMRSECSDFGARYFDGRLRWQRHTEYAIDGDTLMRLTMWNLQCATHPVWSGRIQLLAQFEQTCFYG